MLDFYFFLKLFFYKKGDNNWMLSHFQPRNCLPDLNYRNCCGEAEQLHELGAGRGWGSPGPRVVLLSGTIKGAVCDGNKTKLGRCFKGK